LLRGQVAQNTGVGNAMKNARFLTIWVFATLLAGCGETSPTPTAAAQDVLDITLSFDTADAPFSPDVPVPILPDADGEGAPAMAAVDASPALATPAICDSSGDTACAMILAPPAVCAGGKGAAAELAWVAMDGTVQHARLVAGAWSPATTVLASAMSVALAVAP
jgi:hypothetical protein